MTTLQPLIPRIRPIRILGIQRLWTLILRLSSSDKFYPFKTSAASTSSELSTFTIFFDVPIELVFMIFTIVAILNGYRLHISAVSLLLFTSRSGESVVLLISELIGTFVPVASISKLFVRISKSIILWTTSLSLISSSEIPSPTIPTPTIFFPPLSSFESLPSSGSAFSVPWFSKALVLLSEIHTLAL